MYIFESPTCDNKHIFVIMQKVDPFKREMWTRLRRLSQKLSFLINLSFPVSLLMSHGFPVCSLRASQCPVPTHSLQILSLRTNSFVLFYVPVALSLPPSIVLGSGTEQGQAHVPCWLPCVVLKIALSFCVCSQSRRPHYISGEMLSTNAHHRLCNIGETPP